MHITADSYLRLGAQALPSRQREAVQQDATPRTARVRTTRIGFSLGKLGIEYSSRDLTIDPDQAQSKRRAKDQMAATSFNDALHAESTRRRMLDRIAQDADRPARQELPDIRTTDRARRKGLLAYAASMAQPAAHAPRSLLATA